MLAVIDVPGGTQVGSTGMLRIELSRSGLPVLSDQRAIVVTAAPPARTESQQLSLPLFDTRPVGPDDDQWTTLGWPDDVSAIASAAVMENGTLVIFYSTAYPQYAGALARFEQRAAGGAESFKKRYEIWLATHSLLYYRDQESAAQQSPSDETGTEEAEDREREERCRMAFLAALFASREVELAASATIEGESPI
jgi:hypothetical protein